MNKVLEMIKAHILLVLVVLAVASSVSAVYFYGQYNDLKTNPNAEAQKEVKNLVATVSKLILLPDNETPTVATVADVNKLKDQAFFTNAKAGDKVLIYTNAKKAILYSPESNKIVEVAPVNIGNPATPTPVPRFIPR